MRYYKKFVQITISILLLTAMVHILIWKIYVSKVNNDSSEYIVGDLSRMSYHLDTIFPRENEINLSNKHINFNDYNKTKIDILTIGDSFSNAGGGGLNPYYQDYISTNYNKKVLNILQLPNTRNFIESIVLLHNTGYLKKIGVNSIIIETVQREALERFSNKVNFTLNKENNFDKIISDTYDIYHPKEKDKQQISIINNLNFNALLYNLEFKFQGYGKYKQYYIEQLSKDLFSSKIENELIFYKDDINKLKLESKEAIKTMNDNLNTLSILLQRDGIKLYFMPVVDKYNLYRQYIVSNSYKKSIFFEYLRDLPKKYILIDTKKILIEALKKDMKDLFFSDDTHWNYKASEEIFKKVKFE